jgi:lipopolysaccharide/colanic/teichoic acid biosynthesis glycosyltransferase
MRHVVVPRTNLATSGLRLLDAVATEALNRLTAGLLLVVLAPLVALVAVAIRLESSGPAFFRCRRVGRQGREFAMLKFRKMHASATGIGLTAPDDARFTRLGCMLAKHKLDELPQLWNVLRGEMSLVGPRPEDPGFVSLHAGAYGAIYGVKPGITGLSQLAFVRESEILDPGNRVADYVARVLPAKIGLDLLYAERRSVAMDIRILLWTAFVVVTRREVAVHRASGRLTRRRRPMPAPAFEVAKG